MEDFQIYILQVNAGLVVSIFYIGCCFPGILF